MRRINGGNMFDVERGVNGVFKMAGGIIVCNVIIFCVIIGLVIGGCNYVREKGLRNIGNSIMDGANETNGTNSPAITSE